MLRPSQGFWGTGEQGQFFQGNRGTEHKGLKISGTRERRQFWGTGNIENQDFVPPPQWKGLSVHDNIVNFQSLLTYNHAIKLTEV